MQLDPILVLDIGCNNILACHVNLFLGTLAPLLPKRPDLLPVVQRALCGEIIGNFLLSEIGHGLDITRLETTATKVVDGFILNTPTQSAMKFMPPTTPVPGYPKMAIVFARLFVDGEDRGVHPFLVWVKSVRLPPRSGGSPLDFAVTFFHRVKLPSTAFLGHGLEAPKDPHALLSKYIWRIPIGSMTLPLTAVPSAKMGATIGIDYSFRRHVQGKGPEKVPIISFRTQQLPVLYTIAIAYVLEAWAPRALEQFMSQELLPETRAGVCVVFKATMCRLLTHHFHMLGERLGAQGIFGYNLLSQMEMDIRGISIAEGDILVLSIRLFSELLIGRYTLPPPTHADTLLSRRSAAIFTRGHRDERFNDLILPQSEPAIIAQGCAYAYSCGLDAGVPRPLLDLFELAAIKLDPGWYAEHAGISADELLMREDKAVKAALPHLKLYGDEMNVRKWVNAPIISDSAWEGWFSQLIALKSHTGHAEQWSHNVDVSRNLHGSNSVIGSGHYLDQLESRSGMNAQAKL
ncbi:hypothetical protein IEO21_05917 [Rhodonia placenta]|uniref:Uncharacterized protein n=1 Tax=Rhodonia placenta TaxID=104341 RepID=A0A8H7P0Y6_9APHY|nr:hypothetical protein IEO21_05917 [Postia placenta]